MLYIYAFADRYVSDPVDADHALLSHPGDACVFADRYVWDPVDADHALLPHCPPPAALHRGGQQQPGGQHGLQRLSVCALDHSFYQACLLVSLLLGRGKRGAVSYTHLTLPTMAVV